MNGLHFTALQEPKNSLLSTLTSHHSILHVSFLVPKEVKQFASGRTVTLRIQVSWFFSYLAS